MIEIQYAEHFDTLEDELSFFEEVEMLATTDTIKEYLYHEAT